MIGVICMPSINKKPIHPTNYIQWLESVGIHSIEIPYDSNPIPYLNKCKGVIWIGGAIENKKYDDYRETYMNTLWTSFEYAKIQTDQGKPFLIWGTCLGFEILYAFSIGLPLKEVLEKRINNNPLPIYFTNHKTTLKKWFPLELRKQMELAPCLVHHHKYGMTKETPFITIVAKQDGFIDMFEYKDYPFYGIAGHPERTFDDLSEKVSIHLVLFLKSFSLKK
jgi:hypothetical protein